MANRNLTWIYEGRGIRSCLGQLPFGSEFRGYVIRCTAPAVHAGQYIARVRGESDYLYPTEADAKRHLLRVFRSFF